MLSNYSSHKRFAIGQPSLKNLSLQICNSLLRWKIGITLPCICEIIFKVSGGRSAADNVSSRLKCWLKLFAKWTKVCHDLDLLITLCYAYCLF